MDENGAFKTAVRGGRWPDWKQMLAEVANEGYRLRSSYHAANSTDENDARFNPSELEFVDPAVQELRDEQARLESEKSAQTEPELADAGWL